MPKISRRDFSRLTIAAGVLGLAHRANAQSYPNKPIRLILGSAAGGSTDILARTLGQALEPRLGQPIVIENKLGAGGIVSATVVAQAAPDGYELLLGVPAPIVTAPLLGIKLGYDPLKDLVPVAMVANSPLVLVLSSTVPANNLRELIAYAKAYPGKLNYASTGVGGTSHLGMEMLKQQAGIDITHVPYKGSSQALPDLLAGRIQMMLSATWTNIDPHVQSGKLKYLAMASITRSSAHPEVPTIAESGFPDFNASPWYGVFAPANTPKDIVDRLAKEIDAAVAASRQKLIDFGYEPLTADAAQFADFIRVDQARWAKVIREGNITAE